MLPVLAATSPHLWSIDLNATAHIRFNSTLTCTVQCYPIHTDTDQMYMFFFTGTAVETSDL